MVGWFTVVAYVIAAVLCWRAGLRDARSSGLWRLLFVALVLLGINKQLDLQSMFTAVGRHFAIADHWYDERRGIQHEFIMAVLIGALFLAALALLLVRRRSGGLKIAAVGFILLCGFIVVRASSFHDMDAFLHTQVLNLYWNHVLELGGIAIVAAGAALARPSKRRKKRRRSGQVREAELADPDWLRPAGRKPRKAGR